MALVLVLVFLITSAISIFNFIVVILTILTILIITIIIILIITILIIISGNSVFIILGVVDIISSSRVVQQFLLQINCIFETIAALNCHPLPWTISNLHIFAMKFLIWGQMVEINRSGGADPESEPTPTSRDSLSYDVPTTYMYIYIGIVVTIIVFIAECKRHFQRE